MSRSPDPDRMLSVALSGTAWRLATEGGSMTEAVDILKELSKGRSVVVVETAGVMAGAWSANPEPLATQLLAAALLIRCGPIDMGQLVHWVEIGRQRAAQTRYTAIQPPAGLTP